MHIGDNFFELGDCYFVYGGIFECIDCEICRMYAENCVRIFEYFILFVDFVFFVEFLCVNIFES
jgi:hypothetical protein